MYFSADSNKLIMLCKQCEDDKKAKLSSYYFSDSTNRFVNYQKISTEPVFKKLGSKRCHQTRH
jgi:hypothetical protein